MESTKELITMISSSLSAISITFGLVLLISYRRKIWRSKLTEKQLDYLIQMHDDLCYLNVESLTAKFWAKNISSLKRSVEEFKLEQPEDYSKYIKQKEIYLNYRLQDQYNNYLLIPSTKLKKEIRNYFKGNGSQFAPTLSQLSLIPQEEFDSFNSRTIGLIGEICKAIKKM